jgi:hypothetical protein
MNILTSGPETLVRSFALVSVRAIPKLNDAVCTLRNLATGAIRQSLASNLRPISFGKDAYFLELVRTGGTQ